jgi:Sensors of blue-light using FAD
MISITYVSSAVFRFNETTLLDLVDQCQANNERLGITGILVYSDGNFMQVIEGADLVTHALYERIKLDGRHRGVHTVHQQGIEAREFRGWSMAYNILPPKALRTPRTPHAFLDRARQRPLPLPQGSASSLVCSFMQH